MSPYSLADAAGLVKSVEQGIGLLSQDRVATEQHAVDRRVVQRLQQLVDVQRRVVCDPEGRPVGTDIERPSPQASVRDGEAKCLPRRAAQRERGGVDVERR